MNAEIELDFQGALLARRQRVVADMLWKVAQLVLEYNGYEVHAGIAAETSDRARTNALIHMGYTVLELTQQQVYNLDEFEVVARHIAKLLGKRIDRQYLGDIPQRAQLRKEVFEWNRLSGRAADWARR